MWTTDQMLWRTPANLCTERGTALWTKSERLRCTPYELAFFHPPAVGEKNFPDWAKITKNSARQSPHAHTR